MMTTSRLLPVLFVLLVVPEASNAQGCALSIQRNDKNTIRHRTSVTDDGEKRLSMLWQRGDCELRVEARGEFSVRPDLTAITRVDDRGYVDIEERDGDRERRVRVTSGRDGLEFRWSVDGRNGFDVERERWLVAMLQIIERRTAMFAKTRVPELLRQGGASVVLDETERMDSDYARRVYYTTLMTSTRLDEASIERMLRQVGESMSSDFERSEILRAVARQGPLSDRLARASIAVAHKMSSDFEKRRALSAGLASVNTVEARNALFLAASTMSSDFELAELLIAAQERSLVDSLSRVSYFKAVNRMSSDHEHRRTLSALLRLRPASPAVLGDVLRSSEEIQSDHELATLLVEFTKVVPVRGELRELYLRAARSINSDYEYRRTLQALLEQDRIS